MLFIWDIVSVFHFEGKLNGSSNGRKRSLHNCEQAAFRTGLPCLLQDAFLRLQQELFCDKIWKQSLNSLVACWDTAELWLGGKSSPGETCEKEERGLNPIVYVLITAQSSKVPTRSFTACVRARACMCVCVWGVIKLTFSYNERFSSSSVNSAFMLA